MKTYSLKIYFNASIPCRRTYQFVALIRSRITVAFEEPVLRHRTGVLRHGFFIFGKSTVCDLFTRVLSAVFDLMYFFLKAGREPNLMKRKEKLCSFVATEQTQ